MDKLTGLTWITGWQKVRAQADNFKVDIPSMAKLKVSPNVIVKASPKLLDLSGNVDIPWARIAIKAYRTMLNQ